MALDLYLYTNEGMAELKAFCLEQEGAYEWSESLWGIYVPSATAHVVCEEETDPESHEWHSRDFGCAFRYSICVSVSKVDGGPGRGITFLQKLVGKAELVSSAFGVSYEGDAFLVFRDHRLNYVIDEDDGLPTLPLLADRFMAGKNA